MGTRFLDIQNCRALLPQANETALDRLEACLVGINDSAGPLRGAVRRLVRHNKRTQDQTIGSMRYIDSPIEIAQIFYRDSGLTNLQAITRPDPGPAKLHFCFESRVSWKTIVPLQFLLKGWGDANRGHQGYVHTISQDRARVAYAQGGQARLEDDDKALYYVGITGRNWLERLREHIGEVNRGGRRRFHSAWRESIGMEDVHYVSTLNDINMSYEEAMRWEEVAVERYAYGPNGLNMIPGGFKGLQFLHKHRIVDGTRISLQARDRAIEEYLRQNPRKGVPNPLLSALWKDDDYYLKVIQARPKTLSPDQVHRIRALAAEGLAVEEIADMVGALNLVQVKNVIAGRTYRRLH